MENTEVKVSELQDLCEKIFKLKAEVDDLDAQAKEKNKEIMGLKAEVLKHFEAHNLERFDSGFGTVTRKTRKSVSIEDRNLFFDYLEEKGLLRDSLNVTAATATSIYNQMADDAERNKDLSFLISGIPGLSEPKIFTDVSINKPRKRKA